MQDADYQSSTLSQNGFSVYQPKIAQSKKLIESKTALPFQAAVLDINRTVHFKKGRPMGDGYFVIEISSGQDVLYVTAFNVEVAKTLILEIH